MNIFIPGIKDANTFFEEITFHSKHHFFYKPFLEFDSSLYDVILIQWPELIFNWAEPNNKELNILEIKFKSWKRDTKIIYLVHNIERHHGMTDNFTALYKLVENYCDVMVHFGNYSRAKYLKKYPEKKHVIIPHPLYLNSFKLEEKATARKKLNISADRKVIIAPGRIRNKQERELVLKAFSYFPDKRKTLVVPYMFREESTLEFKGRYSLRNLIDFRKLDEKWKNNFPSPKYYIGYEFNPVEKLSLWMSAADGVLIPRIEILNSGNLYLGLTYKKPIMGPAVGNIAEVLKELNYPVFKPKDEKSIKTAVMALSNIMQERQFLDSKRLEKYLPQKVALKWDNLIEELLKNQKI